VTDAERRHGFEAGLAEYEWLEQVYSALGYEVIMLPKATVPERADFVLAALSDRGKKSSTLVGNDSLDAVQALSRRLSGLKVNPPPGTVGLTCW
jgi:hypothetical protein